MRIKSPRHGAADATVVHLENLFFGVDDQFLIDADLAELVFDDGNPCQSVMGESSLQELPIYFAWRTLRRMARYGMIL